jgi:AbiEi antitoxin C-terminal domain
MQLGYYVGLLSAAAVHGSSHHQPQEFQVVTDRSVRPITVGQTRIRFFASKFIDKAAVTEVKTPTGTMRISTPETTAIDLVRFAKAAGYLDNVATVLSELVLATFNGRRCSPSVPMPFQRSATGANQLMLKAYTALLGYRTNQSRQVVPLREAIADKQNTD